jgi:hypothetical protein
VCIWSLLLAALCGLESRSVNRGSRPISTALSSWSKVITGFGAVAAVGAAIEVYSNLPLRVFHRVRPPELSLNWTDATSDMNVAIIFPGYGGVDLNVDRLQKSMISSDRHAGIDRQIIVYDWVQWRDNLLRAARNGDEVGSLLGKRFASEWLHQRQSSWPSGAHIRRPSLHVHVFGISVGAFAANALAREIKKSLLSTEFSADTYVRVTLLDPFTSKGVFRAKYGSNEFGAADNCDYCEVTRQMMTTAPYLSPF